MDSGTWGCLPSGPLCCVFSLLSSGDLASCCCVNSHWAECLRTAQAPWLAALRREHGYAGPPVSDARQLLCTAKTGRLWAWGANVLGLASSRTNRFTSPEQMLLALSQPGAAPAAGGAAALGGSTEGPAGWAVQPAAAGSARAQHQAGAQALCAASDFVVLLTWDGATVDSRVLGPHAAQQAQQRQRPLELPHLWRPPGSAVVQLAAGGCWQGPGKEGGGHVLALAADASVWAWGSNLHGQLGLGVDTSWVSAPAEALGSAAAEELGRGVLQVSCGEAHSGVLLRCGAAAFAGCNTRGACGLGEGMDNAPVFCKAALPTGAAACRLGCGGHNSALVTEGGRVLVCGDNEYGQCGGGGGRGASACWQFRDLGPDASWHGMQRLNQEAQGGFGQAAARVVDVCCGGGSLYALTDGGEVFAWGQGGQGELGLGGSCKNTASPSKLPWAKDIVGLCAAAGGRFAAVLDAHGRLFTFGAGKFGQLGHGDTNKRAVGRQVKALQGLSVRSVAAGADFMLAIAASRPASSSRGASGGSTVGKGGRAAKKEGPGTLGDAVLSPRASAGGQEETGQAEGEEGDAPPSPSFRYLRVDPGTPAGGPRRRRSGLLAAALQAAGPTGEGQATPRSPSFSDEPGTPGSSASSWFPDTPSTSTTASASAPSFGAEAPSASAAPRLRQGRSGGQPGGSLPSNGESAGGRDRRHRRRRWVPPDPDAAVDRRRRWMPEPPAGGGHCSGGEEAEGGESGGSERRFRYLLRRQLKVFASSPAQRELAFPASLSPYDRYRIHVMAEAWGLMHQSVGEGAERRLLVWKPSRSRKSLKPGMAATAGAIDSGNPGAAPGEEAAGGVDTAGPGEPGAASSEAAGSADVGDAGSGVPAEGVEGEAEELLEEEVLYAQAADSLAASR